MQCPFWLSVLIQAAPTDPAPPHPGSLELQEGAVLGPTWRPLRSRIQNVLPEGLACVQCEPLPPRFLRKTGRGLLSKEFAQHVAYASARVLVPGTHPGLDTQKEETRGAPSTGPLTLGLRFSKGSQGALRRCLYQAPSCKEQNTRFPLLPPGNPWTWQGRAGSERKRRQQQSQTGEAAALGRSRGAEPQGSGRVTLRPQDSGVGAQTPACGVEVELTQRGRWKGHRRAPRSSLPGSWLGPPVCPAGAWSPQRLTLGRNHTCATLDPLRPTPSVGELPENPEMERNPSPEM